MESQVYSPLSPLFEGISVLQMGLTENSFMEAMLPLAKALQSPQVPYSEEGEQERMQQQLHQEYLKLMEDLPSSVDPSICTLYIYCQNQHILAKAFCGRIPESVLYAAFSSITTVGSLDGNIPFLQGKGNYFHAIEDSPDPIAQALETVRQGMGILVLPSQGEVLTPILQLFVRMDVLSRETCKKMIQDVQHKYRLPERV